jgi:glycosyltransferase involved in cell wall biosynthesis
MSNVPDTAAAPRRVLLISNKVFHYRVSNYNYFGRRFREEGWEWFVRANELQANNPIPLEFDFKELPFSFATYTREIEIIKPDVAILFLHLKNLIIWPLIHWLRLKGIKVVYWNKGVNLEVRNPRLRNLPFYYIHNRVDGIVLYSQKEVKDIKPHNRQKVFVANNTINFSAFPPVEQSKEEIKRLFDIPYKKVVLFVGRMRTVKKVEHLIHIFNEIEDPDLGCVIVGDQMQYDLKSLIKRDNVRWLGEVFDPSNLKISQLFKMSDLFCIPGDVGLGLNQAFYWKLPVVTENGLQPPEIHYLTPGENGFIVPENDVAELKEKVLLLLHDDALRARFADNAHKTILAAATPETMFSGFRDCVRYLMGEPAQT